MAAGFTVVRGRHRAASMALDGCSSPVEQIIGLMGTNWSNTSSRSIALDFRGL